MTILAALCASGMLAWFITLALIVARDGEWLSEVRRRHLLGVHWLRHLDSHKDSESE